FLNDEDRPSQSNYLGNGILESSEDTGIDTTKGIDPILGQDPADTLDIDWIDINMDGILLPSFDDYHYSYGGSRNDYSQINGTEGNIRDESGRYPDTEDLDGNSGVNFEDNFFRYRIDLEEGDDNKYIVGGLDNPTGWRLYRIPLSDTLSVGKPLFTSIEYVRIWMTGIDRHVSLKIAQIEIVGNEWQEIQEGTKETPVEPLSVAVINTHDNPEYNEEDHTMPEGVAGEFDPVTQMRSKEQSLVIKINRLRTGEVGRIYKHLMKKINLMNYKYLKMFVHGGNYKQSLSVRGEDLNLEVFFRFGADTSRNYYEYSQILHPGWSEENEILIDLERLTAIKFLREQDSLQNYDILPNGDVMRVVGNPSLSEIKEFVIGIKNFGSEINETDQVEVWVDELRVSDVHRDAGWAARGSMRLEVADLMSFSIDLSQQDANFHRVDSKISSSGNKTALDGKLISSFNLDKFLEPQWGVKIPIKANFNQKVEIPKYKPGSDIRLSALGGEKVDIYSVFNNTLFNNRRMSDNPNYKSPSDSLLTINKGYSFNTSFSKAKKSDNPFIKHSLEKLSLSMNHTEKYITDSRTLYKNSRQNKGSISYSFSLDEPPELSWMGWTSNIPYLNMLSESQFKPVPGSISLGASGSEALTTTKLRTGLLRIDPSASINRNYNVSWHPIEMLSLSFRQQIEADRVIRETLRDTIAAWHVELDSSEFMIPDPEIDSLMILDQERFDLEFEKAKKKVKDELFWQLLGEYMVDNGLSQSFTTSLRPQLFDWLNMDANYSANYRWSWRDSYQPGDRSISSNSSFTTSATFGLQQILGRFLQDKDMQPAPKDDYPGGDDPFGGVDPFGGGSSPFDENIPIDKGSSSLGSSGEEILNQGNLTGLSNSDGVEPDSLLGEIEIADQDTLKEEKPKVDALKPLKEVLKRLRDIRWQYTLSNDISNNSIERGQANWEYRLGLTKDPGLEIVKGFPGNSSHTRRDDHNFSSSLEISRTLRLSSISYEFGKLISSSRTLESINPGNGSESQTIWHYFGKDDDSTDVLLLPILNWSASWSGLSDIEMLKKFTNSISIENSFRGNMNSIWREEQDDSLEVYIRKPQRVDYEKNFTPLIGLSISWLGGVSTNARFNLTQRVSDDKTNLRVKDRAINKSVNVSANYTARRGFRIPIPVWPFKNRKFKNSTSFALTYTFSEEKNERSSNNLPFDSRNTSTSWSVAPTIEYSFSTTVRGGFTYEYSVRKSELAPDVKSQEFGFRVNISIRG
nr:cell surface protein SprA [bacterium]